MFLPFSSVFFWFRFVPRCCTPLSVIAGGGSGSAEGAHRRAIEHQDALSALRDEFDLVGCVFAITREDPATAAGEKCPEVMVSPVALNGGGKGVQKISAPQGTQARDALCAPTWQPCTEREVTYRVYMTGGSGVCVCLERKILPELARHHRILRCAPGSCWAIINAVSSPASAPSRPEVSRGAFSSTEARKPNSRRKARNGVEINADTARCEGSEPEVASAGLNSMPVKPTLTSTSGVWRMEKAKVLTWSSLTAVGGSGGAPPPATIGGTSSGHIGAPLSALRRWAEGIEGRRAVRREGQRLALQLAQLSNVGPTSIVALGTKDDASSADFVVKSETCLDSKEHSTREGDRNDTSAAGLQSDGCLIPGSGVEAEMGVSVTVQTEKGEDSVSASSDSGQRSRARPLADACTSPLVGFVTSFVLLPSTSACGWGSTVRERVASTQNSAHVANATVTPRKPAPRSEQVLENKGSWSSRDGTLWVRVDTGEQVLPLRIPTQQVLEQLLREVLLGKDQLMCSRSGSVRRHGQLGHDDAETALPAAAVNVSHDVAAQENLMRLARAVLGCDGLMPFTKHNRPLTDDSTATDKIEADRETVKVALSCPAEDRNPPAATGETSFAAGPNRSPSQGREVTPADEARAATASSSAAEKTEVSHVARREVNGVADCAKEPEGGNHTGASKERNDFSSSGEETCKPTVAILRAIAQAVFYFAAGQHSQEKADVNIAGRVVPKPAPEPERRGAMVDNPGDALVDHGETGRNPLDDAAESGGERTTIAVGPPLSSLLSSSSLSSSSLSSTSASSSANFNGPVINVLEMLAEVCAWQQVAFTVRWCDDEQLCRSGRLRHFPTTQRGFGVVESVGSIDTVRQAEGLLEELAFCPP